MTYFDDFGSMTETKMRNVGVAAVKKCAERYLGKPYAVVTGKRWEQGLLETLVPNSASHWNSVNNHLESYEYRDANAPAWLYWRRWFWQWMEHAGYVVRIADPGSSTTEFATYAITPLGTRRLDSEDPCRPGALEHLRAEFVTATDDTLQDSLARLEDAFECFDRGLHRPAAVMLGLAYEELISVALTRLGRPPPKGQAKDRQDDLEKAIKNQPSTEARRAALVAISTADSIRIARNDAAHKAAGKWDAVEVDVLLADGVRAYAKLAGYKP